MLTVLVATYNGQSTLTDVLNAYRRLHVPRGGWKLVVVDNGSNDDTPEILHEFETLLPMTRLYVGTPGKNRALNAGLVARSGDLVVLTDDDAIPDPHWLTEYRSAADRQDGFDIFGGTIKPRWPRPPDYWHEHWAPPGPTYSITDPTHGDGPAGADVAFGPNMAIRARVFDGGHLFDEGIGPEQGTSYRMGSETEFTRRLQRLGARTWFVAGAVVEHVIRPHQMERAWVMKRARRFGKGRRHLECAGQPEVASVFGVPRYRLRVAAGHWAKAQVARLTGKPDVAFRETWEWNVELGYLSESRKIHSKAQTPKRRGSG